MARILTARGAVERGESTRALDGVDAGRDGRDARDGTPRRGRAEGDRAMTTIERLDDETDEKRASAANFAGVLPATGGRGEDAVAVG